MRLSMCTAQKIKKLLRQALTFPRTVVVVNDNTKIFLNQLA